MIYVFLPTLFYQMHLKFNRKKIPNFCHHAHYNTNKTFDLQTYLYHWITFKFKALGIIPNQFGNYTLLIF